MDSKTGDRELVITRVIDAPRRKVFRAWTDPTLLKQWFAPLPWTTSVADRLPFVAVFFGSLAAFFAHLRYIE